MRATMDIKPIRSDADYRMTLVEIEGLMSATAGSAEGDRLDLLTSASMYTSSCLTRSLPSSSPWNSRA